MPTSNDAAAILQAKLKKKPVNNGQGKEIIISDSSDLEAPMHVESDH
jgi:hypothetical protein